MKNEFIMYNIQEKYRHKKFNLEKSKYILYTLKQSNVCKKELTVMLNKRYYETDRLSLCFLCV